MMFERHFTWIQSKASFPPTHQSLLKLPLVQRVGDVVVMLERPPPKTNAARRRERQRG
jgi:hypothetical protein